MADSIELRMSVTSIKRVDPYVKDILATATHVALYKFNTSSNEWEKTDTEGALFVYSRNGEPFHSIMVMNRLNTDNLIEPIVKDFDYQMQVPFLLYRNSKSKIFGIWFFNREECVRITFLIESVMEGLKDAAKTSAKRENGVDIFSLLSKAQEDFNRTPTKQDIMEPQDGFSSTPRVLDCTSKSVQDFFAKASTKSAQKPDGENVLQKLMANPANTVEHIEKQQRSITPQDQLKQKLGFNQDRRSVPISFPGGSSSSSGSTTDNNKQHSENGINFLTNSPPKSSMPQQSSPLAFLLQGHLQNDESTDLGSISGIEKPQLMTPMMFTSHLVPKTISTTTTTTATTTTTTTAAATTATTTTTTQPASLPPSSDNDFTNKIDLLTEKQLAQALIHLLKTNSNFTRQIHEAYVNSIMEKVNSNM